LFKSGYDPLELCCSGLPLGIFEDQTWKQGTVQIDPGDVLVLYTDGITEARNDDIGFFGEQRLLQTVGGRLGAAASEIQDKVLSDLHRFIGDGSQSDDIILSILKREMA